MTRSVFIFFATLSSLLVAGVLLVSCSHQTDVVVQPTNSDALTVGDAIVSENLSVYPIISQRPAVQEEFLTLAEAQKQKAVEIRESGGGNVSVLEIENKSDKPLLLIGGEVVYGGKQDRVIGYDTIISAGKTGKIDVFCVEAGRWHGGSEKFYYSDNFADASVRQRAQNGNQSEVWSEVSSKLGKLNAAKDTNSSAYRAVLSSEEVQAAAKKHVDTVSTGLSKSGNVVGIVVAINGRVISCDVFCNKGLFEKYAEKLIRSAAIQALAEKSNEVVAAPSNAEAQKFLDNANSGKTEEKAGSDDSVVARTKNERQSTMDLRQKSQESEKEYSIHSNSSRNSQPEGRGDNGDPNGTDPGEHIDWERNNPLDEP